MHDQEHDEGDGLPSDEAQEDAHRALAVASEELNDATRSLAAVERRMELAREELMAARRAHRSALDRVRRAHLGYGVASRRFDDMEARLVRG